MPDQPFVHSRRSFLRLGALGALSGLAPVLGPTAAGAEPKPLDFTTFYTGAAPARTPR